MERKQRYTLFISLILLMCINNVLLANGLTNALDVLRIPIQLMLLIFLIAQFSVSKVRNALSSYNIIASIVIYILYILIQILLFSTNYKNDISNSLYGFVCFLLFYTNPYIQNEKYLKLVLLLSFVFFSSSFLYFRFNPPITSNPLNIYHALYVNSIYYIVCLLPFLLSYKKSIIYLIVCAICIFASSKQGAFIGIVAATFVYYIVDMRIRDKVIDAKMIFGVVLLLIILIVAYLYISNTYSMNILEGFDTLEEDGGNGRLEIYTAVFNRFWNSDMMNFLFGHGGLGAVSKTIGISAHNDFLEVIFDFGCVGLLLYVVIIVKLFLVGYRFIRVKYYLAPAFMSSIVLFFILSMFSHMAFILKYAMILFAFWGYCLNKYIIYEYKNSCNSTR